MGASSGDLAPRSGDIRSTARVVLSANAQGQLILPSPRYILGQFLYISPSGHVFQFCRRSRAKR